MAAKKWTVLVYLAGDNNLDEDGLVILQKCQRWAQPMILT